jgi:hypothetical protein
MAVLGEAHIVVKAVTDGFRRELREGVRKAAPDMEREGTTVRRSFDRGFARGSSGSRFPDLIPSDFAQRAERARIAFRNFNRAFTIAFPAIVGVGGAIGALGGGLITLIAVLGNAARSAIVFVAALGALGQAGIAGALASRGVADALKAGLAAQDASTGRARNEEAALKRLRDARIALRNLIEREKPEALAQARERARDAADSAADSTLNAERAERSYFEAQREAIKAVEDLSAARDRAREKLQQLRFEVEGAAISEKRARIEFEKARESLQRVQDLPPNSRARQEAELAFAEADLNLRRAIDRNGDLKAEEEKATRAGVEGSQEVIDAQDRIRRSQQGVIDSGIDAARAFRDAAKAQERAAQAAADAQAGGRVERELDERIAKAREAVIEAEKALADAGGGVDKFAQALEKLSPAARRFVQTILDNRDAFKALQLATQEAFFVQFNDALDLLIAALPMLTPLLEETGKILGSIGTKLTEVFLGAENYGRTERVWRTNNKLLENLGLTFVNLTDGLMTLLDAASPVIDRFGEWARQSSEGWAKRLNDDVEGLSEKLQRSADKAARLFGIFGNLKKIFGVLGDVINEDGGAADVLLGYFERITKEGLGTLQTKAKDGSLKQFFIDITENAVLVLSILGDIVKGLLILGAAPGTNQFLTSLKESTAGFSGFAERFGAEDGPLASIGRFIKEFFDNLDLLLMNDSFTVFLDTLTEALAGVNNVLREEGVQAFLAAAAPILAYVLALGLIFGVVGSLFRVFAGFFLFIRNGFLAVSGAFGNFMRIVGAGPKVAMRLAGPFLRLFGIIGLIITAIALMWQNSETFRTAITGIFSAIAEVFSGVMNDLNAVFGEATQGGEDLALLFGFLGDVVGMLLSGVAIAIGIVGGAIGGVIQFIGSVLAAIGALFRSIGDFIQGIIALIQGDTEGAMVFFTNAMRGFEAFFLNIGMGIGNFFISVINGIIDGWNGFVAKIKIPDWPIFGNLAGKSADFLRINRIPMLQMTKLAAGGVVSPRVGGMMAIIGEGGRAERVEPLDPDGLSERDKAMIRMLSGGGGTTINVYPSEGMDEQELAQKVSRELAYQMRKGSV